MRVFTYFYLAVVCGALLLSSCAGGGHSEDLVGTWELAGVEAWRQTPSGERRPASDLLLGLLQQSIGELSYTFNDDQTFSKTNPEETIHGQWEVAEDSLKLRLKDGRDPEVANNVAIDRRIESVSQDEMVLVYKSESGDDQLITRYIFVRVANKKPTGE